MDETSGWISVAATGIGMGRMRRMGVRWERGKGSDETRLEGSLWLYGLAVSERRLSGLRWIERGTDVVLREPGMRPGGGVELGHRGVGVERSGVSGVRSVVVVD